MGLQARKAPTGWTIFAGIVLLLAGIFNSIYGLSALLNDKALTYNPATGTLTVWDLRTWGWVTLVIGVLMIAVAAGLFAVQHWARWVAIAFAGLNAIGWMALINVYPWWAIAVITLDVLVIYNLSTKYEPQQS
ncbi:MAG TPA: hypothetical protein VI316_01000 [Candidatus Dormibacteraeota bacterium]